MISIRTVGTKTFSRLMANRSRVVEPQVENMIRTVTELTKTRIQANASGRPGPNAPTGDYRRSWTTSFKGGGSTTVGIAGTNKPQGRRLEFGFYGPDALGRVYNQPPFPHVGPARDWGDKQLERMANALVRKLLK